MMITLRAKRVKRARTLRLANVLPMQVFALRDLTNKNMKNKRIFKSVTYLFLS